MKKFLLVLLALTMCLTLCACGGGLEGTTLTSASECTARFSNGTLYLNVFGDHQTYSYELEGDDTIIINGILTYTYEIDGDRVTFSDDLIGVSDIWWK